MPRIPWTASPPRAPSATEETQRLVAAAPAPSFKDRGRLRRRLQFLRRERELGFRDVGGLMFDMRRFGRDRPDLLEAKLAALQAVDQELRALERILDDRRPLHELREPGISACARCGALHSSDANFCPQCALPLSGPHAMGEIGGAIAAPPRPPQAPPPPAKQIRTPPPQAPPPPDKQIRTTPLQPTSPTVVARQPPSEQPPAGRYENEPTEGEPAEDELLDDDLLDDLDDDDLLDDELDDDGLLDNELSADSKPAQTRPPPHASGGS